MKLRTRIVCHRPLLLPVTTGAELATVASDVASDDLDTPDAILNAAVVADAEICAFFPANL